MRALLFEYCTVCLRLCICYAQIGDVEHFLKAGPNFIFLFHPSLGPLWDIIAQKLRGGALAPGSELVLEVRCFPKLFLLKAALDCHKALNVFELSSGVRLALLCVIASTESQHLFILLGGLSIL